MPKVTEYTVIIDASVLAWIAQRFRKFYPLENGVFLFGEFWQPSRYNIPYITQASEPRNIDRKTGEWWFEHDEFLRQTKLAAADHRILLGFSHSHPWPCNIPLNINAQSITDARTQTHYRLTISLIMGMWNTSWWCTAWKEGFAAPLNTLVHIDDSTYGKKGSLLTLKRWYYDTYKERAWFFGNYGKE